MSTEGKELTLVRAAFQDVPSVREVKMFGGTAFMVNGHMTVAVSVRGLLVRVGPDGQDEALEQPQTRMMMMGGRVMTGYVYVNPVPSDARTVSAWVQRALRHNRTLAPKKAGRTSGPKKRKATNK